MNCKEFREVLDLYIDEELSPEALIAAQLHSGECMTCQAATEKLLSIRQLLKANNAKHQLPSELVEAVHRISRPWWKPVFHDAKASASRTHPLAVWHRQITLSASTFALILLMVIVFGLFAGRLRTTQTPVSQKPTSVVVPVTPEASTADLARFDHGGRPSVYKEPR